LRSTRSNFPAAPQHAQMRLALGFVLACDTGLRRGAERAADRVEPLEDVDERARRDVFGQRIVGLRDAPEVRPIGVRSPLLHGLDLTAVGAGPLGRRHRAERDQPKISGSTSTPTGT
jgi:hypothetical protein